MWEAFGTRALFQCVYGGGADFGECVTTVARVGDGEADAWHKEWSATADRLLEAATSSADRGHAVSARDAYLRAATYLRVGYWPLFGSPPDPRLSAAFEKECSAVACAAPLFEDLIELVEIPFEATTLPGIFARPRRPERPRPTIVYTNGYDSNVNEMFLAHAPAALERGYNILLFDGPGQGRNLIRDGLTIRPDWENVVRPVIDYTLGRDEVDTDRVVLAGWSFGGFLAPRAAACEHRIAALIADPGQWDQCDAILPRLPLSDQEKASFPSGVDPTKLEPMEEFLRGPDADPMLRWRMIQRGLWVHGKESLFDYVADLTRFELSPIAKEISCPTLLTMAEGDPSSARAPNLFDALTVDRRELVRFTDAEGGGGHCEGMARRLYHQRVYDWLDETLASSS